MTRGSRSSRGVTIREGTGEKNWQVIAAYCAVALFGIILITYTHLYGGGLVASAWAGGFMLLLAAGALPSLVYLFKDSAYLRGTRAGWDPKWWFYIGTPSVAAAVVFVGGNALQEGTGWLVTIFAFVILTVITDFVYLYQRHRFVGVP